MITVDIKDAMLYMDCPMKYFFSRVIGTTIYSDDEAFDEAVHKMILHYYFNRLNGKDISISTLKTKWGKLWYKHTDPLAIATRIDNWRLDSHRKKEVIGVEHLVQFYKTKSNIDCIPLHVNTDYLVPINSQCNLSGKIELIRENADHKIELVDFRTESYKQMDVLAMNDINMTGMIYGYYNLFNVTADNLIYHFLPTSTEIKVIRTTKQLSNFKYTISNIGKAIENEIYYPAMKLSCLKCNYFELCKQFDSRNKYNGRKSKTRSLK